MIATAATQLPSVFCSSAGGSSPSALSSTTYGEGAAWILVGPETMFSLSYCSDVTLTREDFLSASKAAIE